MKQLTINIYFIYSFFFVFKDWEACHLEMVIIHLCISSLTFKKKGKVDRKTELTVFKPD